MENTFPAYPWHLFPIMHREVHYSISTYRFWHLHDRVKDELSTYGHVRIIEVLPLVDGLTQEELRAHRYDGHPNPAYHRRVAEAIHRVVVEILFPDGPGPREDGNAVAPPSQLARLAEAW